MTESSSIHEEDEIPRKLNQQTANHNPMNSTLNNTSSRQPLPSHYLLEPQITWYWSTRIIISVFTVLGNGLVIYLIAARKRLQVTGNWFILSLAVSDFCVGLLVTPSGLACTYWIQCDWRPQLVFYNFLLFASTLNLWAMTYDRYSAIVHPLKYITRMTKKRIITIAALSWGISLLASLIRLKLLYDENLRAKFDKYYRVLMDLWFGVFSFILLVAIYIRILAIVGKHTRQVASQRAQLSFNARHRMARRNERETLSAKILGAVILLFVACYLLSVYISFCSNFKICIVPVNFSIASLLLVHLNCAVNFIVYALLKKDFREELKRLFGCENGVLSSESRGLSLPMVNRTSTEPQPASKRGKCSSSPGYGL